MNPTSFRRGPRSILSQTLEHSGSLLLGMARRLTGNQTEAADLFQDVVEIALRRAPRHLSPCELRSWMVVVLRNRFYDLRRHEQVGRRLQQSGDWLVLQEQTSAGEVEEVRPAPWEQVDPAELHHAVRRLAPSFRRPVTLWLRGSSLKDIGRRLGVKPATAGTRLHRAREKLRLLLVASS